ncbi:hypothetical protein GOP47_0014945 [Adiantum capillus-veneris]|uniref:CRAL-TRIO domain-containing protein n=1 Tax=Adiantum capillus-veneris TaxID=13818 RepID=A0A9D4UNB0_ADICA|nr:hypothetical protein GOP47_0014945 [Adiantum capillus-veneris]
MGSKHSESKRGVAIARPVLDLYQCTSAGSKAEEVAAVLHTHSHAIGIARVADSSLITSEDECVLKDAQQDALQKLRSSLQGRGSLQTCTTEADLLRFLRARSFDVGKARAMYEAMLEWRREIGADTIMETFKFPERKAVKELYPHFHHKVDKCGRPVYIERYGQLHLEDLLRVTTLDRLLLYHIKEWEILINCKFPACSQAVGRPVLQSLTILDLKGVTMKHLNKQVRHFIQKITRIDQDYYPEYLGKMLIINAPTSFKAMWQLIKPWLDKNTPKKIEVHGSSYSAKLLELVDRENLPEFLGGTCRCQGGCENSDAGPWNDSFYKPYPEEC